MNNNPPDLSGPLLAFIAYILVGLLLVAQRVDKDTFYDDIRTIFKRYNFKQWSIMFVVSPVYVIGSLLLLGCVCLRDLYDKLIDKLGSD